MTTPTIHGENVLIPVEKLPEGKTEKYASYIVGHSETGHHHVLEVDEGKSDLMITFDKDGNLFVEVTENSKLVHKKTHDIHETVVVDPGIYKVNRKTEYDPFNKVIRQVWD